MVGLSSFINGTVAIACWLGMFPAKWPGRRSRGNPDRVGDVVPFGGNFCYTAPIQVIRFLLKLPQNCHSAHGPIWSSVCQPESRNDAPAIHTTSVLCKKSGISIRSKKLPATRPLIKQSPFLQTALRAVIGDLRVIRPEILALTQLCVLPRLFCADQSRLKQIDFPATIH
jgi:hypothetical protein